MTSILDVGSWGGYHTYMYKRTYGILKGGIIEVIEGMLGV